jgi:hypothetical protein
MLSVFRGLKDIFDLDVGTNDLESASFFVLNATRRPAYHACFEGQHEFRESIAF